MESVGFTGTRHGMTVPQTKTLADLLMRFKQEGFGEFWHGGCIGADTEAAKMAKLAGFYIVEFPSLIPGTRGDAPGDEILEPDDPLDRNKKIASCPVLIACPKEDHEIRRSGTWATIRYAVHGMSDVYVILPNGTKKDGMFLVKPPKDEDA